MSLIGGTAHWAGPVIGAILLGTTQQLLTVTISSEVNVLVLGVMLVLFVVAAPEGIIGLVRKVRGNRKEGEGMTPPANPERRCCGYRALTKRFGGFTALDNVSVDIRPGERFGLIGPNGSGKTTLINCISGAFRTEAGTVVFRDEDITRLPPHHAHAPRHRAQLPDPAAVQEHDGRRKPHGGARFRGRHRRHRLGRATARHRDVDPDADGPRVQGQRVGHAAQPGGVAQDGARARDGDAAQSC